MCAIRPALRKQADLPLALLYFCLGSTVSGPASHPAPCLTTAPSCPFPSSGSASGSRGPGWQRAARLGTATCPEHTLPSARPSRSYLGHLQGLFLLRAPLQAEAPGGASRQRDHRFFLGSHGSCAAGALSSQRRQPAALSRQHRPVPSPPEPLSSLLPPAPRTPQPPRPAGTPDAAAGPRPAPSRTRVPSISPRARGPVAAAGLKIARP